MHGFKKKNHQTLRQLKYTLQPLYCKTWVSDLHWCMGKLKEENLRLNYWDWALTLDVHLDVR